MVSAAERIIWSADVPTMKALGHNIRKMRGLEIIKIDRAFLERRDPSIIKRIQEDYGIRVFSDAKMVEIPTKLKELANTHLRYRPWMLNCMAGGVSTEELNDPKTLDGLKRFADACHKAGTKPCGVTVLTSKTDGVVGREFNGRSSIEQVLWYVDVLYRCGFTDIVCSPLEMEAIRTEPSFDHLGVNTPGIRFADSDTGDQARTGTPGGAVRAGVTKVIMGRDLTNGNPAENFERAVAEIAAALAA